MYRLIIRCRRNGKLDYLYLTPIVDEENKLCSFGITYDKYKSYECDSLYKIKGLMIEIRENRHEILEKLKQTDDKLEALTGYEIEECWNDFGIVELYKIGVFKSIRKKVQ